MSQRLTGDSSWLGVRTWTCEALLRRRDLPDRQHLAARAVITSEKVALGREEALVASTTRLEWQDQAVRRTLREHLPDGGRTEVEWDDEIGDFDLTRFDAEGNFVERIRRHYLSQNPAAGEPLAEDVFLDDVGNELRRRMVLEGSDSPACPHSP